MVNLEVCIDSIESAKNAFRAGAQRLEVCSSLGEGGLTPSYGLVVKVKEMVDIPIYCMIRPRGGYFTYSHDELQQMTENIRVLKPYCDGFVFGALNTNNELDLDICKTLVTLAHPYPCTFHRAFDVVANKCDAMQKIIFLGFQNVLTSGGEKTAILGSSVIKMLQQKFGGEVNIIAGSGINSENILSLVETCDIDWVHASGKTMVNSDYVGPLDEFSYHFETDTNVIYSLINALKTTNI